MFKVQENAHYCQYANALLRVFLLFPWPGLVDLTLILILIRII